MQCHMLIVESGGYVGNEVALDTGGDGAGQASSSCVCSGNIGDTLCYEVGGRWFAY